MAIKHIRFYDECESGFVPMSRLYGKKYRRHNTTKEYARIDRRRGQYDKARKLKQQMIDIDERI
jgi:hypothetical protein